eukprot:6174856-Pleurochrysis_carterae.AAC.3
MLPVLAIDPELCLQSTLSSVLFNDEHLLACSLPAVSPHVFFLSTCGVFTPMLRAHARTRARGRHAVGNERRLTSVVGDAGALTSFPPKTQEPTW